MFIQNGENTETVQLDSLKTITEKEIAEVEKFTKIRGGGWTTEFLSGKFLI